MSTPYRSLPSSIVSLAALALGLTAPPALAQRLTIERIASLPSLVGTTPENPVWSPDGAQLAFLWNQEGMPFRDLWVVSAASSEPRQVTHLARDYPYPPETSDDPDAALAQKVVARARGGISEAVWTPSGDALVFAYRGDLFRVAANGSGLERLTRSGGGKSEIAFSPDGKYLSFFQGGDLWLWNQETKYPVKATDLGVPPIGNVPGGRYHRNDVEFTRPVWSPDSRFLALHFDDRRKVRQVPFPSYLGEETHVNFLRRDYPGDSDHIRRLGVYSVNGGRVRFVPLPEETDRRFSNFNWSPDGSRLLIDQNSENGVYRWIYLVQPDERALPPAEEIWSDRGERRVTQFYTSDWLADGKGILFVGDLDDRYRLYSLALGSRTPKKLTEGDWDVIGERGTTTLEVRHGRKEVFFLASKKSPYERQVYRMPQTGGPLTQVTSLEGVHLPVVSPDGSRLALIHSNDVTPTELYLLDLKEGSTERRVTRSPLPEFYQYRWSQPRYVTFKSRIDNYTLHGRVMEPPDLDRSKKYAVVLGSVYSNTVRNRWNTLQQFLTSEAKYINLQVDIRGSTGYGRAFREEFLGDWGGGDIEDLASGVEYLKTLPYVDPARIGIWGSSYGGTLTTFSLFKKPGLYRAGVAGAPAVSVAHFTTGDVHISRLPQTHPEVFREASALSYGEKLEDALMIIHGMQDDVVPFRTSILLAEKLMMLEKNFDFVVVPTAAHGWSQKDYYALFTWRKMLEFFDRHLGRGPRDSATPPTNPAPGASSSTRRPQ
jgi:dipeptidyl-peptidase-4